MDDDLLCGLDIETASRDELSSMVRHLLALVIELREENARLGRRVDELEKQLGKGGPPPFVKASKPVRERKERKKRVQQFSRRRERPTETAVHVPATCPDCGRELAGGWLAYRRQVIEVKASPVEITEHEVYGRYCGVCGKSVVPKPDLSAEVLGAHRLGVGLMSLIAYLKEVGRMTVRGIQHLFKALYRVHLSVGEIVKVLRAVANKGKASHESLLRQLRASRYVHMDETGWREDGQNGYLWVGATPTIRCFVYNKSRAGEVAEELLGKDFDKVLVSDFYGGYNRFACRKQRCWVHLLRDLHKLRESVPEDAAVGAWVDSVRLVYDQASSYQQECRDGRSLGCGVFDRQRTRKQFEAQLEELAAPFAHKQCAAPQRVLAQRIVNFAGELFTFVEFADVPSENNMAERAVRPAVIVRKVSGGTRSANGSHTKAVLMSLFHTWRAQGLNPLEQCQAMLTSRSP